MNTLITVPWDQEAGGVASVVGHLATNLVRDGHRVWFLHPSGTRRLRAGTTKWGFPGYQANLRSPVGPPTPWALVTWLVTLPFTLAALLWVLRRHRISVINVHYPSAMFGYFALCRRLLPGVRLVVSIHGSDLLDEEGRPRELDRMTRWVLNSADAIVAPSAGFAAQCAPLLRRARAATTVIHNGVAAAGSPLPAVTREAGSLLTVASLDRWKGLDVLLHAVAILRPDFPALRLELAGEGPERTQLQALAQSLGIETVVHFAGFLDRATLGRRLAGCAVFVLPSRSESLGIAVIEALAAGAPVVASRVGGIPEVLGDGQYGVLVPPGDPAALAAALRTLLDNAAFRAQLSAAGPARAADFPWTATAARYRELFDRLHLRVG